MNKSNDHLNHESNSIIKPVKSIIRLANFIIDSLVWLILYLSIAYIIDLYFVSFNSYSVNYIYSITLGLLIYLIYYSLCEYYFHRTIGKFLTKTKVIYRYNESITYSVILKRTLYRLIPIDIFYYFFSRNGLHDKLSNTLVIKANP